MHLALACVIRARHELYVYYISDVKIFRLRFNHIICDNFV
jgi:hypothetical protein